MQPTFDLVVTIPFASYASGQRVTAADADVEALASGPNHAHFVKVPAMPAPEPEAPVADVEQPAEPELVQAPEKKAETAPKRR